MKLCPSNPTSWLLWTRGVVVNVLNYGILVSEFELLLCYNVHFRYDTIGKFINLSSLNPVSVK